jgi:hypothetical protein
MVRRPAATAAATARAAAAAAPTAAVEASAAAPTAVGDREGRPARTAEAKGSFFADGLRMFFVEAAQAARPDSRRSPGAAAASTA